MRNLSYGARQCNKIPAINVKHDFFNNTFFPSTTIEWNKLDWEIKHFESIVTFKKRILSFIRPSANSTLNCHNRKGIKLLPRLRLGLSQLREHKFKHSFGKGCISNQQSDLKFTSALLFGGTSLDNNKNTFILDAIDYVISAGRFDVPLFSSS